MKKLISVVTLGLAISFSSLSFAFDYMDLYKKPIVKSEVSSRVNDGSVEKDFMSFYITPKGRNAVSSPVADQKTDKQYLLIFGVQIPLSTKS